MSSEPTVFVVDDDAAVRDGLALLLETEGYKVIPFAGGRDFFDYCRQECNGVCRQKCEACLILDVRMPDMDGPAIQAEMARFGIRLPVIFLTAHGDIPASVRAMRAGAIDFMTKPVDGGALLERVRTTIELSRRQHEESLAQQSLDERLASLTERERDVMTLVVQGYPNKEIARLLGISYRTVEIHRARVMQKTGAENLLELARIAGSSGMGPGTS